MSVPLVSVIIPTYRRAAKLAATIRALSHQTSQDFEILVTIDGPDDPTGTPGCAADAAQQAWASMDPSRLAIFAGQKLGVCAARNRAIDAARGKLMVFFNDDVVPRAECIASHVLAHDLNRGAFGDIVVGDSPWVLQPRDSLFARMLRDTSMVFFHHRMRGCQQREKDWGFRHAWLLNLSASAKAVRAVGGLRVIQQTYGRDDDELAFRMTRELGMRVLWRPEAIVDHDHAMTPAEYLSREKELGAGVMTFARGAPECALAMFGRDVLSGEHRQAAAEFVDANAQRAAELTPWFMSLDQLAPDAMDVDEAYRTHLPLKRWWWNRGYLSLECPGCAAAGQAGLSHLSQSE